VKNSGGTPAHNISLEWDTELKNHEGDTIGFQKTGDGAAISVLLPGESISQIIGGNTRFVKDLHVDGYTGIITFQDPMKRTYHRPFRLDAQQYSGTPTYDDEALRTHSELQKIPKELEALRKAVEKLPPTE
jgi:hypothetical protein